MERCLHALIVAMYSLRIPERWPNVSLQPCLLFVPPCAVLTLVIAVSAFSIRVVKERRIKSISFWRDVCVDRFLVRPQARARLYSALALVVKRPEGDFLFSADCNCFRYIFTCVGIPARNVRGRRNGVVGGGAKSLPNSLVKLIRAPMRL